MMSDEIERIRNAKRNDEKYYKLKQSYVELSKLIKGTTGNIEGDDPDFPKSSHIIIVSFENGIDDICFVEDTKRKLISIIDNCDEFVISADLKNRVEFVFGFTDIYTENGTA